MNGEAQPADTRADALQPPITIIGLAPEEALSEAHQRGHSVGQAESRREIVLDLRRAAIESISPPSRWGMVPVRM